MIISVRFQSLNPVTVSCNEPQEAKVKQLSVMPGMSALNILNKPSHFMPVRPVELGWIGRIESSMLIMITLKDQEQTYMEIITHTF